MSRRYITMRTKAQGKLNVVVTYGNGDDGIYRSISIKPNEWNSMTERQRELYLQKVIGEKIDNEYKPNLNYNTQGLYDNTLRDTAIDLRPIYLSITSEDTRKKKDKGVANLYIIGLDSDLVDYVIPSRRHHVKQVVTDWNPLSNEEELVKIFYPKNMEDYDFRSL